MKKTKKPPRESQLYTPAELREIANLACVDPKTVSRWLDGKPVRPTGRSRIVAALKARAVRLTSSAP